MVSIIFKKLIIKYSSFGHNKAMSYIAGFLDKVDLSSGGVLTTSEE